jgi:arabinogalactan oligomer/maltooligosaccharide transport system permease protein
MIKSRKWTEIVSNTIIYTVLTIMSVIWLVPIFWLVLQSFKLNDIGGSSGLSTSFFPATYTFNNYINLFVFNAADQVKFPLWFLNTFIVATITCLISTILVLMTSYAFSRLDFKARKPMMKIILILGMFPGFMTMIAIYHILKLIGLTGSIWGLILVYSGGAAMGYYISKGFFDTIPKSIDEAAMIDGASKSQIFWQITLPLSKPIVIYTALTSFIGPWGDFIFARLMLGDNLDSYTVARGLYWMITRENIQTYFTRFCAGAVIIAIPITLLFIWMQKYYVSGVTGGSVKG